MENKKNNGGILVGILIGVVVMLLVFIGLFMTNTISFTSKSDNNSNMSSGNEIQDNKNNNLTESEAINIVKNLYNDAVRHIFNEGVSYCGKYATGDNVTLSLNGFSYSKSATFNSFEEIENYLKGYMTESLLASTRFNQSVTNNGVTISSYYEKDGSLYCNGWNKGGNMELTNYLVNESTFTVTNITKNSFDGTINAVYNDVNNVNKTTKIIKVSVIRENNKWLLNTYEEQ